MDEKKIKQINDKWEKLGLEQGMTSSNFESVIFPLVKRVNATTLGYGPSKEELENVSNRVKSENRDRKIKSLLNGSKYTEKKLEDDPEYKELSKKGLIDVKPMSAPNVGLLYIDYNYNDKDKDKSKKK